MVLVWGAKLIMAWLAAHPYSTCVQCPKSEAAVCSEGPIVMHPGYPDDDMWRCPSPNDVS